MPNTGFLGWAHVSGSTVTHLTGSDQNVLFYSGSSVLTGSDNFFYDYTNNKVTLTGSLDVSGSSGVNIAGNLIINSETADAPGAGWSAGVTSYVRRLNGEVVTTIFVDLGAASAIVPATDGYAVGPASGSASYLTKLTNAVNGVVTVISVACVETPASSGTAVTDLNLHLNTASKNANAQVDTGTHAALLDGGDEDEGWDDGAAQGVEIEAQEVPTGATAIGFSGGTEWYLYLTAGDSDGNGSDTYNAGKFVITLYGWDF